MLKQIDREVCRVLRDEIEVALAELGKRHGLSIHAGNASFTTNNVTFKVELAIVNPDGTVENKDATAFKAYAELWGMKAEDLGKTVTIVGRDYEIIGAAPRSRRAPILARAISTNKTWKLPLNEVKKALGYKVNAIDMMHSVW